MGRFYWAGLLLIAAIPTADAQPRPKTADECRLVASQDAIAGMGEDGDIRLASGRRVKLLDMRLAADGAVEPRALTWLSSLVGAKVQVAAAGRPDRWERLAAALTLDEGAIDVADLLVAEGLALVSAEERDALCRPELLAREALAREQRHGIWSDPGALPLSAGDLPALKQRVGRFALVEGQVRSVGERAQRTYLNFGAFGEDGFTVTIPKRAWSRLRAAGVSAQNLRRRRVRVRGVAEAWRGVAMEITVPSMLEVLDDKRPE